MLPCLHLPIDGPVIPFGEHSTTGVYVGIADRLVLAGGLIGIASDQVDRLAVVVVVLQGGEVKAVEISTGAASVGTFAGSNCAEPRFGWILAEQLQEALSFSCG